LLDRLRSRGFQVYQDEVFEEALYFVVEGPYTVREYGKEVIADKEAAESVMLGADLYAPGVAKCDDTIEPGDEILIRSPVLLPIARGIARMSCRKALKLRRGLFVEVTEAVFSAPKLRELPEFREGLFYPQSLPAIATTRVLDPQPGETIADMCAAPGGKTGHIVELVRGNARIYAFDHSKRKIAKMKAELARLGHTKYVNLAQADSRYLHVDYPSLKADKVLLDPPCTALGVRPKVVDEKSFEDVINAAAYQEQFLRTASRILKRGGVLVYSTCTVTHEENELLIERVATRYCLELVDTELVLGSRGSLGTYRELYTRFHPHIHDAPGYFIAKMVKKC
ncbi:MAG: 16S rRNA methyltransferase, partial [Thermoprotei archaeon]